eukprot:scaffold62057_cov57-Phaeocystis_antarctica.AAC.1
MASTCASFMYPSPACTACSGFTCSSISSLQLQTECNAACTNDGRRLTQAETPLCPSGNFLNPTCLTCSGVDCSSLSLASTALT